MSVLTRDEILKKDDFKLESVDIPEWGGEVLIRTLGGRDRDQFDAILRAGNNVRATFAAMAVCDEKGRPVFTLADAHALGEKNAKALDRIIEVGFRLNGMTDEAIADAEKN